MTLLKRRPTKKYPVVFRCACGKDLQSVNAAGENLVSILRQCTCGRVWTIDLEFTGWTKQGIPTYIVQRIHVFQK